MDLTIASLWSGFLWVKSAVAANPEIAAALISSAALLVVAIWANRVLPRWQHKKDVRMKKYELRFELFKKFVDAYHRLVMLTSERMYFNIIYSYQGVSEKDDEHYAQWLVVITDFKSCIEIAAHIFEERTIYERAKQILEATNEAAKNIGKQNNQENLRKYLDLVETHKVELCKIMNDKIFKEVSR